MSMTTALANLLADVLDFFGEPAGDTPTDTPDFRGTGPLLRAHPSPFNPRTTIELMAPPQDQLRVEVFDLRGRRVRVLHGGPWPQGGALQLTWNGRDDRGSTVSSGVYVVRASGVDLNLHTRVVLLK